MKKIGVLTSGGDAPGMNAAIRAVVRTALYNNLEVYGIKSGYQGLVSNNMDLLSTSDVSNIIQRGGTILKTARCKAFFTDEGIQQATEVVKQNEIDGLIVIGGDGTFRGAQQFYTKSKVPCVGIPCTIDNDIAGTHYTIGFDTAVNTAIEAIDKIRDTASAHNRVFIVEVMGRKSGLIALQSGISCGAEDILVPEMTTDMAQLIDDIDFDKRRNKLMRIVVICEGDEFGGALKLQELLKEKFNNMDIKTAILGHIQRGGSPSHYDRWIASKLGYNAVNALLQGTQNKLVGIMDGKITFVPFINNYPKYKLNSELVKMGKILSF